MRGLFTNQMLSLASGQVASGIAHRTETLRITAGRVWITVEGIDHDYFLHAGDTFTAIPGRLTVVEAEQDAGIDCRRSNPAQFRGGIAPLFVRLLRSILPAPTVRTSLQRHRTCGEAC